MHIFEKNVLCHRSVLIYNNFNKFVIFQNENMQQIVFTARIDSVINVYNVHQIFFLGGGGKICILFSQISHRFPQMRAFRKKINMNLKIYAF